jgi:hypothetical protein
MIGRGKRSDDARVFECRAAVGAGRAVSGNASDSGDGRRDLWLMSTPCGKRGFWEEWAHGGNAWERISVPATECAADKTGVSGGRTGERGLRMV